VSVEKEGGSGFRVRGGRHYESGRFLVESDASSASYFFLAAALCGGRVRVVNMNPRTLQGDIGFLRILKDLGCSVSTGDSWVEVIGKALRSGSAPLIWETCPTWYRPSRTGRRAARQNRCPECGHLRIKESNRLSALVEELRKVGVQAGETEDGMLIEGGRLRSAEIETYNDHRIAMSFAMLGLLSEGFAFATGNVSKSLFRASGMK